MLAVSTSSVGWAAPVMTNDGSPVAAAAPPAATVTTPADRLTVIPEPATTASLSSSESIQSWYSARACSAEIFRIDANTASIAVRITALVRTAMSGPICRSPVGRVPVYTLTPDRRRYQLAGELVQEPPKVLPPRHEHGEVVKVAGERLREHETHGRGVGLRASVRPRGSALVDVRSNLQTAGDVLGGRRRDGAAGVAVLGDDRLAVDRPNRTWRRCWRTGQARARQGRPRPRRSPSSQPGRGSGAGSMPRLRTSGAG